MSTAVPKLPKSVEEEGHKALSFYHSVLAEVYGDSVMSDLPIETESPSMEVLWIPASRMLNIKVDVQIVEPKRVDPALLMKHGSHYYVVGLWNIGDEEDPSFEGLLREFTVGTAEFPKMK